MVFSIDRMRQALKYGGARPNLFNVFIDLPNGLNKSDGRAFTFLCKSAQLPGVTLGAIEVPYMGRTYKIAGNKTFAEWTTTILVDEDFKTRNVIEKWMELTNTNVGNETDDSDPRSYQANLKVNQFAKDGSGKYSSDTDQKAIKQYTLYYGWPSDISPIDVGWDQNDQIMEYTVTWQYSYWTSKDTTEEGSDKLSDSVDVPSLQPTQI